MAEVTISLRGRMRFNKLRVTPNATNVASTFNEQFQPEIIAEHNDPYQLEGIKDGQADPQDSGYAVQWPIRGTNFNTRDYGSSGQTILADVETVMQHTLRDRLGVYPSDYKFALVTMGFKQLCAKQESLTATYGAGLSNAHMSVTCIEEGLIIPETRLNLNMRGDAITEFVYVLLNRIHFAYRDINLARSYDWSVIEDLKPRVCALSEVILLS
ncbi:hypothetical protein DFH07DRAFT_1002805 [Mycena maculata]|uniref:Uncharacterized protein n=1 Tax=Mycena maculata TaxID=230809 RepID=A0AAD7MNT8_9AGAR|nr:hypothetical protein DFH07DRAFT_1002805 [Mycena maculata]